MWLVKRNSIGAAILHGGLGAFAPPKPRENFIPKWVEHFDFVVEGVSDNHNIFFWDKMHSLRALKLRCMRHTISVSKTVQILWVLVATGQVSRACQ